MNELEFRVWYIKQKVMGNLCRLSPVFRGKRNLPIVLTDIDMEWLHSLGEQDKETKQVKSNVIIMQYIKVKDIKNKKIFEEDIAKVKKVFETHEKEQIILIPDIIYCQSILFGHYYTEIEILGNKYQNPELMKEYNLEQL